MSPSASTSQPATRRTWSRPAASATVFAPWPPVTNPNDADAGIRSSCLSHVPATSSAAAAAGEVTVLNAGWSHPTASRSAHVAHRARRRRRTRRTAVRSLPRRPARTPPRAARSRRERVSASPARRRRRARREASRGTRRPPPGVQRRRLRGRRCDRRCRGSARGTRSWRHVAVSRSFRHHDYPSCRAPSGVMAQWHPSSAALRRHGRCQPLCRSTSKRAPVLLGPCLSARFPWATSSSGEISSCVQARPRVARSSIVCPATATVPWRLASSRPATSIACWRLGTFGHMTRNSSPPSRPTWSSERSPARIRRDAAIRIASPVACPYSSLTLLKPSRSTKMTASPSPFVERS